MSQIRTLNYGFAGTAKYGQYYRHSGQVNAGGVGMALVAGLVAGAILGTAYSAAVIWIPFIKLRCLACLGFGLLMGAVPATILLKLKVRNVPVSLAVVGVATLFSFYISWASWEAMVGREVRNFPSFSQLVVKPVAVYRIATLINDTGTWSLGGSSYSDRDAHREAVSGTTLSLFWAAEALTLFAAALVVARKMLNDAPFCEKCEQWCSKPQTFRATAMTDVPVLKQKLEAGDFGYVATLPPPANSPFLEFSSQRCEKCTDLRTLTVKTRTIKKDKKGRVRENNTKTVVNKLLISDQDLMKLMPTPAPEATARPSPSNATKV